METESGWYQAWRDTEYFRESAKSFWFMEVVGAAMFGVGGSLVGYYLTPIAATTIQEYFYPAAGGALGIILGFVVCFVSLFAWYLFRAPYRQRNEARADVIRLNSSQKQIEVYRILTIDLGLLISEGNILHLQYQYSKKPEGEAKQDVLNWIDKTVTYLIDNCGLQYAQDLVKIDLTKDQLPKTVPEMQDKLIMMLGIQYSIGLEQAGYISLLDDSLSQLDKIRQIFAEKSEVK